VNILSNQHNRVYAWTLHILGATAVTLILGAYYVLLYQPLERQRAEAGDRIAHFDRELLRSGTEGREYRQLRDQLSEMTDSIAKMHVQLHAPQQEVAFVAELRSMADAVDLDIVNTQVGVTKTLSTHSQREVALDCHGSYASICQFLQQAEQFTKITKLSKFKLSATENSTRYPIQLTFVLYSEGNSHDTKQKRGVL